MGLPSTQAVESLAQVALERARLFAPAVFACMTVFVAAAEPLLAPPLAIHLFGVALLVLLGALALALFRRAVPLRWVHAASVGILACPLAATLVPLAATGDDIYATLYVMQIASTVVVLDTRWLVGLLGAANAAAIPIIIASDGPHTPIFVAATTTASMLSLLIHALLQRALINAETLRFEHERTSGRLAESEASFRSLVETYPEPMFVVAHVAEDFEIRWVNDALLRWLGFERAELVGKRTVDMFVHPDDRERLAAFRREEHGGVAREGLDVRYVCKSGDVRHVHSTARIVTFDGRQAVLVTARDMTDQLARERERRAAEEVIRKSEERHRLLFDGSPLPICVYDAETRRFVGVNAKMVEVYGYSRDELLEMTVRDIEGPVRIADTPERSVYHRRKDGTQLEIDVTAHELDIDGRRCVLAIGIDVTAARRIEEQLRQSQRMEAIGQLAGGVAHDFNNILAVILSNAEMLADELGECHPLAVEVGDITAATQRAAGLTRQLLAFSRKQHRRVTDVALNSVITNLEKMLSRIVGEDIKMTAVLPGHLGTVRADAGQLEQVLMNLVVNARDAMPSGGSLVIETSNVELDEGHAAELGARPGRYVMLAVSDTGCGMTSDTRARIFEPFFTTKEVGKGTGLGLATVFGIVKQTEGAISVYSEVGRGTTFRVYLPHVEPTPSQPAVPAVRPRPLRGSETILVVEDDALLRAIVGRQLQGFGYKMLEAHDPQRALELAASHPGAIDLLLTDLVMPGMDGRTLASQILEARSTIKVLYMSGYTEHAAVKSTALSADDRLLEKPFTANALSRAIRDVLDAR